MIAGAVDDLQAKLREQTSLRAFVRDEHSRQTIEQVAADLFMSQFEIRSGSIRNAILDLGRNRSPRILIVDVSEEEMPLSLINELAEVCEPGVAVIAVGDRNDVGLFRDLIGSGVSDYLVKPVSVALLHRCFIGLSESAPEGKQAARNGRLITVSGTRGGVGATMVATGLAWTLATQRRRRVALVDLDLQYGTAALALDLEPSRGLREALEHPARIDGLFTDRVMSRHSDTLYVLSAEEDLGDVFVPEASSVDVLLKELRAKFHYVVVDVPRHFSHLTNSLSNGSNDYILVTDLSLAGMRDTLRHLSIHPRGNSTNQITLIGNRVGEYKEGEIMRKEFEAAIGRRFDLMVPFDARSVATVTNAGKPVASGGSKVDHTIRLLADRLCGVPSKRRWSVRRPWRLPWR